MRSVAISSGMSTSRKFATLRASAPLAARRSMPRGLLSAPPPGDPRARPWRLPMQVIYERCAGLDVHKRTVVACVVCSQAGGTVATQVRTFGTMTAELAALARWLGDWQVERVALGSSGVYWWPVFKLLEEEGQAV